jgi:glycosyltransferase involved in cell wall biosynthesis
LKKIFLLTDTAVRKSERLVFNSVGLEISILRKIFSEVNILGYEIKSNEMRNQLLIVDNEINVYSCEEVSRENNIWQLFYKSLQFLLAAIKNVKVSDVIYVRGPGYPMFVGLFLCLFFPKKTWWFKFANIWNEQTDSRFWNIQKLMLRKFSWIKVTVNGKIKNDPSHIINFENPCLFEKDRKRLSKLDSMKEIRIVFAGRITEAKGIYLAIDSIKTICKQYENIKFHFTIVGPGKLRDNHIGFQSYLNNLVVTNLGTIAKKDLLEVFQYSHLLLLPTRSPEGFPKVVAEAMSMGCIPIVTNISAIPDYVTHGINGFLLDSDGDLIQEILNCFNEIHLLSESQLVDIRKNAQDTAYNYFTYERFSERVKNVVLN